MKTLKEQLTSVNEELYRTKRIDAEYDTDFLKIGPLDIDRYNFVMIDEPLGTITLITKNELNTMAEDDKLLKDKVPNILKLYWGETYKYYDTIFVKI